MLISRLPRPQDRDPTRTAKTDTRRGRGTKSERWHGPSQNHGVATGADTPQAKAAEREPSAICSQNRCRTTRPLPSRASDRPTASTLEHDGGARATRGTGKPYVWPVALHDMTDREAVRGLWQRPMKLVNAGSLTSTASVSRAGIASCMKARIIRPKRSWPPRTDTSFPIWGPLTHAEFSGGNQTTAKAKELGFEISVITDDLGVALARFMELFKETPGQQFSGEHPAYSALRNAAQRIESLLPRRLAGASVKPSVGQGNWASVPWIAVLHPAVTSSTQEGVYPVLLFHPDMESVEVTIAQGVTKLKQTLGRPQAYERLEARAITLRGELDIAAWRRISCRQQLRPRLIHARTRLRRFDRGASPLHRQSLPTSDVSSKVRTVMEAYADLLDRGLFPMMDQSHLGRPKSCHGLCGSGRTNQL